MSTHPALMVAALAVAGTLTACDPLSSRTVIAPDGQQALFVQCGADDGACFALAGQNCPLGYDIRPAVVGRGGAYLVRCRYSPAPVAQASPPAPAPPAPYAWSGPSTPPTAPPSSSTPTAIFPSSPSPGWSPPPPKPTSSAPRQQQDPWPPPEPRPAQPWDDLDLGY